MLKIPFRIQRKDMQRREQCQKSQICFNQSTNLNPKIIYQPSKLYLTNPSKQNDFQSLTFYHQINTHYINIAQRFLTTIIPIYFIYCSSMSTQNHFRALIQRVSGNNRFQYKMFLNFMAKWTLAAMILFSLNFFYYVPDFTCTDQEMKGFSTCEEYVCSVESQQFWLAHMQKPLPKSISLDYEVIMVCSKQWISSLLQSCSYFGSLIGYIIMPLVADNKGRKIAELISWIIAVFGCSILLISFNLQLVGIASFMMGFGTNAAINLHYSFIKQLVVDKLSQSMMIFLQVSFSIGIFLIALVSWLITDWKISLGFTILLPSVLIFLTQNWIEQTPEFSLTKGIDNFLKSLNKISSTNKGQKISIEDLKQVKLQCQRNKSQNNLTFMDLFRYDSLLKLTIICALIDFIIQFTYDGTLLSLSKIGINVYLDQMLVGILEVFAAIFASLIVSKVQRKKYCQTSFILVSLFTSILGILSLIQNHETDQVDAVSILQMIFLGFLRVTLNCVWGVFFVFIAELYPSQITSVSFGWVSIVGNIGATISPFIRLATAQFTLFFMAILNVISAILIKMLKETKGQQIKFRIQERQNQKQKLITNSILTES